MLSLASSSFINIMIGGLIVSAKYIVSNIVGYIINTMRGTRALNY